MLKRLAGRLLIASLVIIPNLRPLVAHANESPAILIGEVAWAGSSLSTADEWLELWNASDEPIELAGYELRGAGSESIVFDTTHTLAPKSAFVIANYSASDTKSVLALEPNVITTTISLSNSTLHIELFAPDGALVDTAGDGTPPAGSSLPNKASMIRLLDGGWISATSSANLDPDITDFATPGMCDGCTEPLEPEPLPGPTMETPTSTEPFVEAATTTEPTIETSTSTEPVLDSVASSTESFTATPTSTIELPISDPEPMPVVVQAPQIVSQPAPPLELYLHAVLPAPESGDERIEIEVPADATTSQANGWSLRDASATIFRFTATNERVAASSNIWRVSLTSARLNNSGDTVELVRPDGSVAERMTYPETPRGKRWIKNADKTAWVMDPPDEPESIVVSDDAEPVTQPPLPTLELPVQDARGAGEAERLPAAQSMSTGELRGRQDPERPTPVGEKKATIKTPAAKKSATKKPEVTKKTTTKTTKTSATKPVLSIDMANLYSLAPETRVSIAGTVATKPGILNKYHFILLAPDGHGLYVRGTSKQPSPAFGAQIRVTGTLSLNDDGLQLKMGTSDRWTEEKSDVTPSARIVDLLDPAPEDAWSLVELQAQIVEAKASEAMLDVDGVPVTLRIRPAAGYRGARLKTGDGIRVRGLIDTRSGESILYLRSAEDIEITKHAEIAPAESQATRLPDWTPFGAAGITVAAAEGWKRVRRWQKDRKVQALIAAAHAETNL